MAVQGHDFDNKKHVLSNTSSDFVLKKQNLTYELFPSPTQNHIHPSLLIIELTKIKPFSELRKKCDFARPVMIRIKGNKDSNYP